VDENVLIHSAQQGDLDAFNSLVLTYQSMAFNVAYRILSDEDSAEDATQNAFLSAYRSLKNYRGGSFRAWLMRIVTNACYDDLRYHKRRPTVALEPTIEEEDEELESPRWLADETPSPEQKVETVELDHAIQHCLMRLPDNFRSVVVLVDIEGMDYQEVAEAVHTPLGTVKSRLARARKDLRDCLQKFWELLPLKFRLEHEEVA
jgi:RNA polymerase sigma-70 factor, ECF subfamily